MRAAGSNSIIGIEFDHDVGVAFGPLIAPRARTKQCGMSYAPRARTKQCGMSYAPRAQRGFIFRQPVYDLFTVHGLPLA
jgi:hypothetical protein